MLALHPDAWRKDYFMPAQADRWARMLPLRMGLRLCKSRCRLSNNVHIDTSMQGSRSRRLDYAARCQGPTHSC